MKHFMAPVIFNQELKFWLEWPPLPFTTEIRPTYKLLKIHRFSADTSLTLAAEMYSLKDLMK